MYSDRLLLTTFYDLAFFSFSLTYFVDFNFECNMHVRYGNEQSIARALADVMLQRVTVAVLAFSGQNYKPRPCV